MRQLTIRNIDDETYERLRDRARLHRRSLEAELREILHRSVEPDRAELVRLADRIRAKTPRRDRGSIVRELREDRDR
jgi:plasmid stability protein